MKKKTPLIVPEKRDHRHDSHRLLEERVPSRPRQVVRVEPDLRSRALRAPGRVVVEDEADEARLVVLERVFGCFAALAAASLLALRGRGEGKELALLRPRGRGRGAVAAAASVVARRGGGGH